MEFFDTAFKDYKFEDKVKYGKLHRKVGTFDDSIYMSNFDTILKPRINISNEDTYERDLSLRKILSSYFPTLSPQDYLFSPISVGIKLLIMIRSEYINYNRYTLTKIFRSKLFDLSPSLSYLDWRFKLYKGGEQEDTKSYNIIHCMNMLKEYKVPDEKNCSLLSDSEDPNLDAFYYARKTSSFIIFKILKENINFKTFKWLLRHGYPIYCSIVIFKSSICKENYIFGCYNYPIDASPENIFGSQPIIITGYNLNTKTFYIMSTVSNVWGDYGHGVIPVEYVLNPEFCGDFWTLTYDQYFT